MYELTTEPHWKQWQKFVFLFVFLFIGFYLLNYELVFIFLMFGSFEKLYPLYKIFITPLHWLDTHLYHTGYDPKLHDGLPGDNHYGIVFFATAIILFLLIAIIWSIIDRRKSNFNKLYYWFRLYIRYMVAVIMLGYGLDKLIPVQMPYPDVTELLEPMGEQSLFGVAWNFVGVAPGYEMLTGTCEVIASLLLVFRRTYVFGALFMCAILGNVIALNIFYNISVKMYSSLLLVSVLFLLVPVAGKLMCFFFYNQSISLTERIYRISTRWKEYLLMAFAIILLLGTIVGNLYHLSARYRQGTASKKHQKLYDVAWFIANDTIPPLLTDTLRWKRFAFAYTKSAVIYSMNDKADFYDYDIDSIKHIYTLHNGPDTAQWNVFHYSYPQRSKLQFTGKWKGADIQVMMDEVPIDSMRLNKEKIIFLQD